MSDHSILTASEREALEDLDRFASTNHSINFAGGESFENESPTPIQYQLNHPNGTKIVLRVSIAK